MSNLMFHTTIDNVSAAAFLPNGIRAQFHFIGEQSIERIYHNNDTNPFEDIDDTLLQNGVTVHQTNLCLGAGPKPVLLESGITVKVAFVMSIMPEPPRQTLWLIITPM